MGGGDELGLRLLIERFCSQEEVLAENYNAFVMSYYVNGIAILTKIGNGTKRMGSIVQGESMKKMNVWSGSPQTFVLYVFILNLMLTGMLAVIFNAGSVVAFDQCTTNYSLEYRILVAGLMVLVVDFFVMIFYSAFHGKKWSGNKKIGGVHVAIALAFVVLTASPIVSVFLNCKANFLDNGATIVFVVTVLLEQAFFICLFALFVAVLSSLGETHE